MLFNVQKFKLATMFSIMFAGAFIAISALFYYLWLYQTGTRPT